jgi:hypothetical protein
MATASMRPTPTAWCWRRATTRSTGLHLHAFRWPRHCWCRPGADDNQIGGALPGQRNIIDQSGNGAIHDPGQLATRSAATGLGLKTALTLPGAAGNAGTGVELAAGAQQ